jgi:hypothetical protein
MDGSSAVQLPRLVPLPASIPWVRFAGNHSNSKESAMTASTKTPFEHVGDALKQLKEMHHYSKGNVERLSAQWLLFDGELKKLKQAGRIEELMTRQAELHEAIEAEIAALEELSMELAPKVEESGDAASAPTKH